MGLWSTGDGHTLEDREERSGMQLDPQETALLVIDVQTGLFHRSRPIFRAEALLETINGLSSRFRSAGAAVVFIQHANKGMLRYGTPDWQLHEELLVEEEDIRIEKEHGNAFEETRLGEAMNTRGILNLVITGLVTHGCVRATCEGAFVLGYRTILVEDAHSNYHEQAETLIQEWNEKLSQGWAECCRADDIQFQT